MFPIGFCVRWSCRWKTTGRQKFPELTLPLFQDLKKIFKTTEGQIFLFRLLAPAPGIRLHQHAVAGR